MQLDFCQPHTFEVAAYLQVTVHDLGGTDGENCCVVLACDGIFDVMNDEEAVSLLIYASATCIDIAFDISL